MVSCLQDFLNRKREEILYCVYTHMILYVFRSEDFVSVIWIFEVFLVYFVSVTPRFKFEGPARA